ncbi:hypothetical protein HJ01_02706 [Flavobacterium frigoris PS1]|uniref:Uncharacterized protein n=1 Tax=Flavobacterium frigoris (strain PS1) TaxID=1086011 RepID=H7FUG1_FLAFP|nr:hypothetical protein HJ01_02706 [Flavobacterium frigoris PS1]
MVGMLLLIRQRHISRALLLYGVLISGKYMKKSSENPFL